MRGLLMYKSVATQHGFHIPTKTEWGNLVSLMTNIGISSSSGNLYSEYLHIPFTGFRNFNATVYSLNYNTILWSSSYKVGLAAYDIILDKDGIVKDYSSYRSYGCPVRCFANTPIIPDSTRITIYQQSNGKGIYWNNTLGVISITNGTTTITIKDKNEGATTVFNYGDTLTAAMCGKVYQWGNMYGFTSTVSTLVETTSSTQVNTIGYGNGIWYNSNVYITGNDDWSSSRNNNLWNGAPDPTSL